MSVVPLRPGVQAEPSAHAKPVAMIEIDRVTKVLEKYPERFLTKVFTPLEVAFCRGRVQERIAAELNQEPSPS